MDFRQVVPLARYEQCEQCRQATAGQGPDEAEPSVPFPTCNISILFRADSHVDLSPNKAISYSELGLLSLLRGAQMLRILMRKDSLMIILHTLQEKFRYESCTCTLQIREGDRR